MFHGKKVLQLLPTSTTTQLLPCPSLLDTSMKFSARSIALPTLLFLTVVSLPVIRFQTLSTASAKPPATTTFRDSAANQERSAIPLHPADKRIGRFIPDFSFTDLAGKPHKLSDFSRSRLLAVAMTSTSCPLSRKYLPTLQELTRRFADQSVSFILVNCVSSDEPVAMQQAAATLQPGSVYTADADERFARHIGAATTTEVVLLDGARTVLYQGAVDDQYGIGSALEQPRRSYLAEAITAVLRNEIPAVSATSAPGCALDFDAARPDQTSTTVTWHSHISRILQRNCLECHRGGGVGPFPLETLQQVIGHAAMIRQVVADQSMPPWFAAADNTAHRRWANDRSLSATDKQQLLDWLDGGRSEGNPADAPLPRQFPTSWLFGEPDQIIQIPKPIRIKSNGVMGYQNILVEWTADQDRWVQGYEIQPTDRSVVHHVLVNVSEPGDDPRTRGMDGIGGYWAAYVPGNTGHIYPTGFARRLPAKASIRFQIHYTPNGQETHDQLKLGLHFADQPPQYIVRTIPLAKPSINIPPNAPGHTESLSRPVPVDIPVMGLMAHMHVRGKAFRFDLTQPDGTTSTLLDIPRYDFNWQLRYEPATPLVLPRGSKVTVTAVYDNSSGNPSNPNPAQTVRWGEQTHEEMLIGYVETWAPFAGPPENQVRNSRRTGGADDSFRVCDADGNGFVTLAELQQAAPRIPRLRDQPESVDRLFRVADINSDKQLSADEFRAGAERLRRQ
ncbi:MAG: redoxin family protein [Planctomycetaceae bacterium]